MDAGELRILVAEDDVTSRILRQEFMKSLAVVHTVVNGQEAIDASRMALQSFKPYQLICLDIMMPEVDGLAALVAIRDLERNSDIPNLQPAKIVMTTAVSDVEQIKQAAVKSCDGYLIKPVARNNLMRQVAKLFLPATAANAAG